MAAARERKSVFKTTVDGPTVNPVYSPSDLGESERDLSGPAEFPYTRNIMPAGYRTRLWTMRQYSGFATVEETNRRYKYLFEQGQTGFSVAFHLPTQMGYDSDHPLALPEIGKVGVAIDSLKDMEDLWEGIPLGQVSTSMTINATAAIVLAMYIVAAEGQGVDPAELNGTVQNDVLKEYIARNTHIFGPEESMRLTTDICAYCAENLPKWNSISISGYHMREAGCTAVQEVAFTLANGIAYVQAMLDRGMEVDSFAPRFAFFFVSFGNLFEEVAKFRAARRAWAKIMKDRFHAQNPRSMMLRYHVQTGGSTLTEQQPLNNTVRVAIQALAAVLGGCQSLHACSWDEAMALPTEEAVQLSLRTQQIIAHESGVADTVDPLGGSYYVEWLTDQIEQAANESIAIIDEMGGAPEAIKQGYLQREIHRAAYNQQKAIDSGDQVVIGVNAFTNEEEADVEIFEVDPAVASRQIERLNAIKASRDGAQVEQVLAQVRRVAESDENLMPALIDAVRAYATVGEISDALREVFAEYREPSIL
jgi:methylmalonyl-CoA mutase N-terminal domain/subunit